MLNKFEGVKDERDIILKLAGGVGCVTNQEESDSYANALAKGNYPIGLDGCFTVGMSGGCGFNCFVFQNGECSIAEEVIENLSVSEISYLYDNEIYKDNIDKMRERGWLDD